MSSLATLFRLCADPAHLQVSRPGWLTHAVSLCSLIPHMQGGGPAQDKQSGLLVLLQHLWGEGPYVCPPPRSMCHLTTPQIFNPERRGSLRTHTQNPTLPSSAHERTEEACLLEENREIYRSKCLNDRREEKENEKQTSHSEVPGPALFLRFSY